MSGSFSTVRLPSLLLLPQLGLYSTQSDCFIAHRTLRMRFIYPDRFIRRPFHLGKLIAIITHRVLDCLHIDLILPSTAQPRQFLNAQPRALHSQDGVLTYALGFWAISVSSLGSSHDISDRWQMRHPFLHVLLIARVLRYEVGLHGGRDGRHCCQVSGDVRNGVLGEEHGSLNVLLKLPIVEH